MPLLSGWEAELRCDCEQRGAAVNTVRLPRWLLTSCSATWFLTGHGRVPACGPGACGSPGLKGHRHPRSLNQTSCCIRTVFSRELPEFSVFTGVFMVPGRTVWPSRSGGRSVSCRTESSCFRFCRQCLSHSHLAVVRRQPWAVWV